MGVPCGSHLCPGVPGVSAFGMPAGAGSTFIFPGKQDASVRGPLKVCCVLSWVLCVLSAPLPSRSLKELPHLLVLFRITE